MKKLICLTILIATVSCSPNTDEGSHYEAAQELLVCMKLNETMIQTVESMLELEIQTNPQLERYRDVMRAFFVKHMTGEAIQEDFAKMYMETFTEPELRDLIKFYKTETGQKSVEVLPALTQKGARWGQQKVMDNMAELELMIEEEDKRLEALQDANASE